MKKAFKLLLLIFIFSCVFISCINHTNKVQKKFYIVDDIGNKVSFDKVPQRIITLAPNLTEMIYDLKLEKYLVGNTLFCNYPEEAKKIEKVGDMLTFDFEKIVALKPDLIFITVEGNTKETYDKFKELGLKIFVSNPRNIAGIKKTYLDIAKIFGVESKANNEITKWDSITNIISRAAKKFDIKSAMFPVELNPIMLAGKNTFINEYLELCGLYNIASDVTSLKGINSQNYPTFNREEILKRNPDYIIIPGDSSASVERILSIYPEWKNLKAIKNNHGLIFVDRDLFSRPGPRFAEALIELFTRLHPQEKVLH